MVPPLGGGGFIASASLPARAARADLGLVGSALAGLVVYGWGGRVGVQRSVAGRWGWDSWGVAERGRAVGLGG